MDKARKPGQVPAEATGGPNSLWEWVVAAIGLALVLATTGTLGWLAATGRDGGVEPVLQATAFERQGERWRVELHAYNAGSAPASGLRVVAQLHSGGEVVEEAEAEFQYLPGHSSREAAVFFQRNPRTAQLVLLPRGYEKP